MDKLQKARIFYGLSVVEAARIMGVSVDRWRAYEMGIYPVGTPERFRHGARLFLRKQGRASRRETLAKALSEHSQRPARPPKTLKALPVEEWNQGVRPSPRMINSARRWLCETMAEAAARAGAATSTWHRWENGKTRMPLSKWLTFLGSLRTRRAPAEQRQHG